MTQQQQQEQLSPRHALHMTRFIESSLADHYEGLFPEEHSPTALLGKFLDYRPKGSRKWDSEDAAVFACGMHRWLSQSQFDPRIYPRLCAIGALAGMYDFAFELVAVVPPVPDGERSTTAAVRCGCTMRSCLTLKKDVATTK